MAEWMSIPYAKAKVSPANTERPSPSSCRRQNYDLHNLLEKRMTEWHKLDILKSTVQPASTDMVESGLDLYQRMTRVSSMSKELKPATTINEQIKTLRERGMQVDEQLA